MSSDLNAVFLELKAKDGVIGSVSARISDMDVGDVIQIDLIGINSAGVIKAIDLATRSSKMSFDHVVDKQNRRVLVKRLPDLSCDGIDKRIEEVKAKIIKMVSESGPVYESSIRQRITRGRGWGDLVSDTGSRGDLLDNIFAALISYGKLRKNGPIISIP